MYYQVLGSLQVVDGGQRVELGPPKQRAVLAALLIESNRSVSLDRLIFQLWGENAPTSSLDALRVYVSNLRRLLEPDRAARTPPKVLVTRSPGYALLVADRDYDAPTFEALAREGAWQVAHGRPRAALRSLQQGLALWRGPAFADPAFEAFARPEASRLEELRITAVEDRLLAELALGEHGPAAAELASLVESYPFRERLWGLYVRALYRCDRQAEALRAYKRARTVLVEQLGIEPSPALRQLEADVLAQSPALDWQPPPPEGDSNEPLVDAQSDRGATSAGSSWALRVPEDRAGSSSGSELAASGFVGRERELAAVDGSLLDLRQRKAGVVLVIGEPGIGKTRLLEEAAARATAAGAIVAWGTSEEGEGAPPFWCWAQVVRAFLAAVSPDVLRPALEPVAAVIAQVVPEVTEVVRPAEPLPPLDPAGARFRFYEGVSAFLEGLARHRPVVVVLDDLHWADPPSLRLAAHVGRRVRDESVLLLAAYRSVDPAPSSELTEALGVLARLPRVRSLPLEGLSQDEVARFIALSAGAQPSVEVASAVWARTDGNPFFVGELTRLLSVEEAMRPAPAAAFGPGTALPFPGLPSSAAAPPGVPTTATATFGPADLGVVPAGVQQVIRRRVAQLPESTASLLNLAAVAGRDFSLRVVAAAAGVELDEALDLLDVAVAGGLVVEDRTSVGRLRFCHALIQETVYGDLSPLRRARLHLQVGDALESLEARTEGSATAELAHHFFLAEPVAGPSKAIEYALAAAAAADQALAFEAAEEQLRRALHLIAAVPPSPQRDHQEFDAQERLATLLTMTRGVNDPDAGAAWRRATALSATTGDHRKLLASLWGPFVVAHIVADETTAFEMCERMDDLWRATGDEAVRMVERLSTGGVHVVRGRLHTAYEALAESYELAVRHPDTRLIEVIYFNVRSIVESYLGVCAGLLGRESEGQELAEASVARGGAGDPPFTLAQSLWGAVLQAALRSDTLRALEWSSALVELSQRHRFSEYLSHARIVHLWATALLEEGVGPRSEFEAVLAEVAATGSRIWLPVCRGLFAQTLRASGRGADALHVLEEGLVEASKSGVAFYSAELHRLKGELLLARDPGDVDRAQASLEQAVHLARQQGALPFLARAELSLQELQRSRPGGH